MPYADSHKLKATSSKDFFNKNQELLVPSTTLYVRDIGKKEFYKFNISLLSNKLSSSVAC